MRRAKAEHPRTSSQPLMDMGVDSYLQPGLVQQLAALAGRPLPQNLLFDCSTARELARAIFSAPAEPSAAQPVRAGPRARRAQLLPATGAGKVLRRLLKDA